MSSMLWRATRAARLCWPTSTWVNTRRCITLSGYKPSDTLDDPLHQHNSQYPRFDTLERSLSPEVLQAIIKKPYGLKHMSIVQAEVLPLLPRLAEPYQEDEETRPRDLLVQAKTGTGKTLAFLVPAIEARLKAVRAAGVTNVRDHGLKPSVSILSRAEQSFARKCVGTVILSPTRELATQIGKEALKLSSHLPDFDVQLLIGGMSKGAQIREWIGGRKDIVVATPGRMRDLLADPRFASAMASTNLLVLDEADTLLDMGFRDDIDFIVRHLPKTPKRQTFLFSATISREIEQIARRTLDKSHLFINTVPDDASPVHSHVSQYHTVLPSAAHQIPHILRLLAHDQLTNPGKSKSIVFFPTTAMTQLFSSILRELSKTTLPAREKTTIYEIHSKRPMDARMRVSNSFRNDKTGAAVLVTSDVSARGVDYPNVTRVIQVGIPSSTDQYVHRVGRTGRAGTAGRADLVLLDWEVGFVTWELTEMPLKPLTVAELKAEVDVLATRNDDDPLAFFPPPEPPKRGELRWNRPITGFNPYKTVHSEMIDTVRQLLDTLDEEQIKATFMAMLGYYVGKAAELRLRRHVIVQSCKEWATDACGLPTPPYVSDSFLKRTGALDSPRSSSSFNRHSQKSWVPRGDTGRGRRSWRDSPRDDMQTADSYQNSRFQRDRPSHVGSRTRNYEQLAL